MEKTILTTEIYAMFLQLIVISATVFETKLRTKKSNAFFMGNIRRNLVLMKQESSSVSLNYPAV